MLLFIYFVVFALPFEYVIVIKYLMCLVSKYFYVIDSSCIILRVSNCDLQSARNSFLVNLSHKFCCNLKYLQILKSKIVYELINTFSSLKDMFCNSSLCKFWKIKQTLIYCYIFLCYRQSWVWYCYIDIKWMPQVGCVLWEKERE